MTTTDLIQEQVNELREEIRDGYTAPRIYTRCPACKNDTLTINKGHLLCTWHVCPDPVLIDRA